MPTGCDGMVSMKKNKMPPTVLARCRKLRSDSTDAERRLWSCLRDRQLAGFKFRRQYPVGRFILDFYCHEARLAVELDGGQHDEESNIVYDEKRTRLIEAEGVTVLRFWNSDVFENLQGVLETILDVLETLTERDPHPTLSQRERANREGEG